ncbi:MAG: hypothetical protein ACE5I9_05820 [Candidatus Methylomirabilales bacterium]
MPHRVGIVAALLLLTIGTAFGGFFGRYQGNLYRAVTRGALANPDAHHLSGHREKDARVLERIRRNFRGKLVRFHNHANGLALVILLVSLALANSEVSAKTRTLLTWGVSIGGVLYPFGWLLAGLNISSLGVEKAQDLGVLILAPAGIVVILCTVATLVIYLLRGWAADPTDKK